MRYLGNKTRLLPEIERAAAHIGFRRGTVCDLFAGTAVVGRYFRSLGNRVLATDLMESSYLFQRVFLELDSAPRFDGLVGDLAGSDVTAAGGSRLPRGNPFAESAWQPTLRVIGFLERELEPYEGLLTRQYTPASGGERRYLREETGTRVDAILAQLRSWRTSGKIDDDEHDLLLAATIDATDRLANISGTYGAFLKKWQSNTGGAFELRLPAVVQGPRGAAHRRDALEWIGEVEADLLYIDPPYNQRQYASNYHLMEIVARIPREPDLAALEASIYGKTGLIPWQDKASPLCQKPRCVEAFRELLLATRIPRVVISYNEEGIIARADFEEMLAEYAGVARSRLGDVLEEVAYSRFRSDSDGRVAHTGASRNYRQLPGRSHDQVHEWLFRVAKKRPGKSTKESR